MTLRILQDDEELDPILSVVNLVDVFLVMIGALMMIIAANPLNPFATNSDAAARNATAKTQTIVPNGKTIETYTSTGQIGSGQGTRAGVAYRLKDGSFVYVPDTPAAATKTPSSSLRSTKPDSTNSR